MNFDFNGFVYALVTSTTYGNWLPGDERGFVDGSEQNVYGTPYRKAEPELKRYATELLKSETVFLDRKQAETILVQWQKETRKLDWHLFVVAVMSNHFHLVVAAPQDTDKAALLNRFKSRASFALNKHFGKRTWWTSSGSVRFSFDEPALQARLNYVKNQKNPLILWENPEPY